MCSQKEIETNYSVQSVDCTGNSPKAKETSLQTSWRIHIPREILDPSYFHSLILMLRSYDWELRERLVACDSLFEFEYYCLQFIERNHSMSCLGNA